MKKPAKYISSGVIKVQGRATPAQLGLARKAKAAAARAAKAKSGKET